MGRARISACIAVYNGVATLGRALDSMLGQTRPPDEVILLDDGSSDDSVAIARSYPGVRVIEQKNAGIGAARKRLVEEATGDWIAFNDHDDLWAPEKLEVVEPYLEDPDVTLVYTGAYLVDESGNQTEAPLYASPDSPKLRHLLPYQNNILVPAAMIRRATMLEVGNYRPEMKNGEDTLAFYMLLSKGKVVQIPRRLAYIFKRSDSTSAPRRSSFEYEIRVYTDYLLPNWDAMFGDLPDAEQQEAKRIIRGKMAHLKTLIAEWHDWEGNPTEARRLYWEAIRLQPNAKGAWYRYLRSRVGRKTKPAGA